MNIAIVNPPAFNNGEYIREGRCMQLRTSWASLWMPLTLAYCSSVLRDKGHYVRLIDSIAGRIGAERLCELVRLSGPDLIVLNTAFPSIKGDLGIASQLKKSCPSAHIVAIGMYPTLTGAVLFDQCLDVDSVIVGEPEWSLARLAAALEGRGPLDEIEGLLFREGRTVVVNAPQALSAHDLGDLPFPARDMLDNNAYRLPALGDRFTLVNIGRGCPYSCIFCTAKLYYGKRFRKRTAESVADELEECVKRYGIGNFLFWGESFTLDRNYGEQICAEIIRRGLKIRWSTTSRVDTIDRPLLAAMKRAGCVVLGLGIESVSQSVLDRAGKETSVDAIRNAVYMVKDSGIKAMGHFIFGLPGDTGQTAQETIRFARSSGIEFAQFYCAVPYPGTVLGAMARENGWIVSDDLSAYDLSRSVMNNEILLSSDVMRLRDLAYRRFYFRAAAMVHMAGEIRSFRSLIGVSQFLEWMKPRRR